MSEDSSNKIPPHSSITETESTAAVSENNHSVIKAENVSTVNKENLSSDNVVTADSLTDIGKPGVASKIGQVGKDERIKEQLEEYASKSARKSCPEFLIKLVTMLRVENPEIMSWEAGRIYFRNPQRLVNEVLKRYFRHANYNSFKRQLNYFGFRKVEGKGKMEPCVYTNEELDGLSLDEILHIKRKTNVGQELMVVPPVSKVETDFPDQVYPKPKKAKVEGMESQLPPMIIPPSHRWTAGHTISYSNDPVHRNLAQSLHSRNYCPPYMSHLPPSSDLMRTSPCPHGCMECGAAPRAYHNPYYPQHYAMYHGHSHGMHYPIPMPEYYGDSYRRYAHLDPHAIPISSYPNYPATPQSFPPMSYAPNTTTANNLTQKSYDTASSPPKSVSVNKNFDRLITTAEMMKDSPVSTVLKIEETPETSSPMDSPSKADNS